MSRFDHGDVAEFTTEDGTRTFALSDIMMAKSHTGRGIARALHALILPLPLRRSAIG
ncbi:hypothetical protein [Nocardia harenae]|uniref:hypothetical protein n=1 Tax=Nocardia harenae TaxID=358707 RepID=UPI000ACC1925|nr:hypothetical protein [Nocardia harenae]